MTLVNGLCVSVFEDAYHFALTPSPSADVSPSTIEASIPFSMAQPDALGGAIRSLNCKFATLNPDSQTIFCRPSTIRTVHLRTIMNIVAQLDLPSRKTEPIAFRRAYSAALSATDLPASSYVLFIESTGEESESELIGFEPRADGRLLELENGGLSVFHTATGDLSAIAEEVYREAVKPDMIPEPTRFVILGSPLALAKAVERALTTAHPSIPVYIVSPADLSKSAQFALPDPNAPRTRVTATYIVPVPVSIESADGGAVVAVPDGRKIRPADESVLLTTSVDNQTSVTVRISLGNHPRAEDNLLSGTVVLEGLRPMPKGEALILVRIIICHQSGATVTVEQVIGRELGPAPRKVVEFPDLIRHLGSDYSRFRVGEGHASAVFLEDSVIPVGELPV